MAYALFNVTFSYETPGERAVNREKSSYRVVAEYDHEAKALVHFRKTRIWKDLGLTVDEVKVRVTRASARAPRPRLSLAGDQERFQITSRVMDGRLEYLVSEHHDGFAPGDIIAYREREALARRYGIFLECVGSAISVYSEDGRIYDLFCDPATTSTPTILEGKVRAKDIPRTDDKGVFSISRDSFKTLADLVGRLR